MNKYKWFYKGKTGDVVAPTSYLAQQIAARVAKAKHSWDVTVVLCERADGSVVEHSTTEL